ncbi:DNA repair exonuclease [Candidatus Marinimicrobia bacterium MT.SAG.3]|nr:DNA repair exonuclease [Candidatus Marinimicrobia bacterium MT.SAG.3]
MAVRASPDSHSISSPYYLAFIRSLLKFNSLWDRLRLVRLLHLADLHLGAKFKWLGEKSATRKEDLSEAFKRAIDFAVDEKNKIDAVLFAGDTFDSHKPSNETTELFRAQLDRLKKGKIHSILIPGNHDAYEYSDSLWREEFDWLHLLGEPEVGAPLTLLINSEECHFYGFAFDSRKSNEPFDEFKTTGSEGFHIALIHGSLGVGDHIEMHSRSVPLNRKRLVKTGMNYIALGHYHNFDEINEGGVTVVYPGTLEGMGFGEDGERWLVVAELSQKGVKIRKEKINKRTLLSETIDLSDSSDATSTVRDRLKELSDDNTLLKLELTGSAESTVDVDSLLKAYEEQFFLLKIVDNLSLLDSKRIEILRSEVSVRGNFVDSLLNGLEKLDDRERSLRELALRKGLAHLGGID